MDSTYSLPDVFVALSDVQATGCLRVDASQGNALVFLRDGQVYAATVPTDREPLGTRMVSSGLLSAEDLAAALDAQTEELLSAWRLGELVVWLGMADRLGVERLVMALLLEDLDTLLSWDVTGVRFRPGILTRQDVTPAVTIPALLDPAWRTLPDPPRFMPIPFELDEETSSVLAPALVGGAMADELDGEVWAAPLPEVVDTADVLRQIRGLNALAAAAAAGDDVSAASDTAPEPERDTGALKDLAKQASAPAPEKQKRKLFRRKG